MDYEKLQKEATQQGIDFYEEPMETKVKGLYGNKTIWVNKNLQTSTEKTCILAEEFGHYHTSVGDSLDQTKLINRKQEYRARNWSYENSYHYQLSSKPVRLVFKTDMSWQSFWM